MNKGGIRCGIPKGAVTRGNVMEMMPFDNRVVVMDISGKDLLAAFDIMASQRGQGVSRSVAATYDPEARRCLSVTIGGEPIDPSATYTLATIDYLAGGGDYLTPLTHGKVTHTDPRIAFDAISDRFRAHPKFSTDSKPPHGGRVTTINIERCVMFKILPTNRELYVYAPCRSGGTYAVVGRQRPANSSAGGGSLVARRACMGRFGIYHSLPVREWPSYLCRIS